MSSQHPPELKGFHNKSMKLAFLVFLIPLSAGAIAMSRQEVLGAEDSLQRVLGGLFMLGVGVFMITILIKATISLPSCEKCQCKMKQIKVISLPEGKSLNKSKWRIVECPQCKEQHRIPGLSSG